MRTNLKTTIELRAGSQIAFAKTADINPIRLNRIVNGWIEPTTIERARFAELLNVDAAWLFRIVTIPTTTAVTTPETTLAELSAQIGSAIKRIEETEKS